MLYLHVPIMELQTYKDILAESNWTVTKFPLIATEVGASGFANSGTRNALVRNYDAWLVAYKGDGYCNNGFLMKHFNKTSPKYHKMIQAGRTIAKVTILDLNTDTNVSCNIIAHDNPRIIHSTPYRKQCLRKSVCTTQTKMHSMKTSS